MSTAPGPVVLPSPAGNHLYETEGGGKRVLCPYDPKQSHMVLESELEKHKFRCPNYRLLLADRAQPYYRQDANSGPPCEPPLPEAPPELADGRGQTGTARARRHAHAAVLGEQGFNRMLARIEAAAAALCPPGGLPLRALGADGGEASAAASAAAAAAASGAGLAAGGERMVMQQASIVGNMRVAGLLEQAEARTFVEMGAGKGYLSFALAGKAAVAGAIAQPGLGRCCIGTGCSLGLMVPYNAFLHGHPPPPVRRRCARAPPGAGGRPILLQEQG